MRHARAQVAGDVVIVLLAIALGHQYADIAAEHFHRTVAEQAFGRAIEDLYESAMIDECGSVDGGIEECLYFW